MKLARLLSPLAFILIISTAHAQAPTNFFNQETSSVNPSGDINLDFLNSGDYQLRIGAFSGETIFDMSNQSLQYKKDLSKSLALYGGLGITTAKGGTSTNTVLFGAAYTIKNNSVFFNLNPIMINSAGTSTVDLKMAAFIPLSESSSYPGKLLPGISVDLPISPSGGTAIVILGARWEVKPNLTLEAGLFDSGSGLQFPGLFRVNLAF